MQRLHERLRRENRPVAPGDHAVGQVLPGLPLRRQRSGVLAGSRPTYPTRFMPGTAHPMCRVAHAGVPENVGVHPIPGTSGHPCCPRCVGSPPHFRSVGSLSLLWGIRRFGWVGGRTRPRGQATLRGWVPIRRIHPQGFRRGGHVPAVRSAYGPASRAKTAAGGLPVRSGRTCGAGSDGRVGQAEGMRAEQLPTNRARKRGEAGGPLGPPCAMGRPSASADDSHDDQAESD
jgi:hypothetical protein